MELKLRFSQERDQLFTALSAAQLEIEGAPKEKTNPHFHSQYADLASVWNACRVPLAKNGLCVIQSPMAFGPEVAVTTIVGHKSGQWMESDLNLTALQNTPQAIGSAITYARRYALAAMVGVAPEDDDGNAASTSNGQTGIAGQRQAAAQQAAAARKIEPKPAKKPFSIDTMHKEIEAEEKRVGSKVFWQILGGEGVENVKDIKTREDGFRIWSLLKMEPDTQAEETEEVPGA